MKLLIDECLSPELTKLAHDRGYGESSHVVWLGKAGAKDWELKPLILDGDWTFVTRNADDFRGSASRPGQRGQYAGETSTLVLSVSPDRTASTSRLSSNCSGSPWTTLSASRTSSTK